MNYERLQITDHVDKWDVAKVQHLEDAIIANEIAINNAADWNQNDASASDYIKNKPFYETKSNIQKICTEKEGTVNTQFSNGWYGTFWDISDFENLQWPNNGQICSVTINGEKYEAILIGGAPYLDGTDGNNFYLRFSGDGRGSIAIYYATAILDETCVVSIDVYDAEIKQLDEKFIPNSVKIPIISDWNQNNENASDFIKNKTHYKTEINYPSENNESAQITGFDSLTGPPYDIYVRVSDYIDPDILCNDGLFTYYEGNPAEWNSMTGIRAEQRDYGCEIIGLLWGMYDTTLAYLISPNVNTTTLSTYEIIGNNLVPRIDSGLYLRYQSQVFQWNGEDPVEYQVKVKLLICEYHKIDKLYLPDETISDWNEMNSSSFGYIKNKTHYSEVIASYYNIAHLYNDNLNTMTIDLFNNVLTKEQLIGAKISYPVYTGASGYGVFETEKVIYNNFIYLTKEDITEDENYIYFTDGKYNKNNNLLYLNAACFHETGSYSGGTILEYAGASVKLELLDIHTLNQIYLPEIPEEKIPDTIARVSDTVTIDTIPIIDKTLTIEGAIADAKAVGDAIVQSDWEQYNETQLDYIRNRTHYHDVHLEGGGFGDAEPRKFILTFENSDSSQRLSMIYNDGQYFVTKWNGIIYDTFLGGLDQGYPFELVWEDDEGCPIYKKATIDSETIEVEIAERKIENLKQLNEKFIPNTIARTTSTVLEDITEAPTAEQYNALLQVLRDAGILAIE